MSNDQPKKLTKNLAEKFREFITEHPPVLFNRRLRHLLMDYMMLQQKVGFPLDFNLLLWELSDLFDLLDCVSDEWENQQKGDVVKDQ